MIHLKIGDNAPDFIGKDQEGKEIKLSDFKAKKLALYFYPKDMTPGCTEQACNLRDNYDLLTKNNISIVGVSADPQSSHQKFIAKHQLPFRLIADESHDLLNKYGVWGPKKFMGKEYDGISRTTFLINEEGKIVAILDKPKTKDHASEILENFK